MQLEQRPRMQRRPLQRLDSFVLYNYGAGCAMVVLAVQ